MRPKKAAKHVGGAQPQSVALISRPHDCHLSSSRAVACWSSSSSALTFAPPQHFSSPLSLWDGSRSSGQEGTGRDRGGAEGGGR
jgi:hypothetical protein